eukprot:364543-Chlamydomonas_euryale.AAC.2
MESEQSTCQIQLQSTCCCTKIHQTGRDRTRRERQIVSSADSTTVEHVRSVYMCTPARLAHAGSGIKMHASEGTCDWRLCEPAHRLQQQVWRGTTRCHMGTADRCWTLKWQHTLQIHHYCNGTCAAGALHLSVTQQETCCIASDVTAGLVVATEHPQQPNPSRSAATTQRAPY